MTEYRRHQTREGDRWDLLAWDQYGDATAYERIRRANPGVPAGPVLPGGLILLIPVIEATATPGGLPPWKR